MGQNLTGRTISSTYEDLVQISGSRLTDGLGVDITSITVTSSFASQAGTAGYAATAGTSGFATSASFAVTASYALNAGATVDTGSLMVTGSATNNVLTFTKGDGSQFSLTVATGSAVTTPTGSLMVTGSVSLNTLTFTKGDGSQFSLTVDTGSAVTVNTGSLLLTASISDATTTYTKGDGSTFALTVNNVQNATSASYALTASYAANVPVINTGSFMVTGSQPISQDQVTFTKADGSTFDITINNVADAGFATNATNAATASIATSASYSVSSSQAQNAVTASFALSASYVDLGTSATASFTGTTWTFNHNLNNEYVIIDCYDSNGEEIIPQTIDLVTANQAVISFPVSVSGTAVASLGNGIVQASITNNVINNTNISTSPINTVSYNLGASTSPSLYRQKLNISTPGIYNLHVSESGPYWVDLRDLGSSGSGSVNVYMWADQLSAFSAYSGSTVLFSGQSGSGNYVSVRTIITGSSTTEYWVNNTSIGGTTTNITRNSTLERRDTVSGASNPTAVTKNPDGSLVFSVPNGNLLSSAVLYRFTGTNGTPIV